MEKDMLREKIENFCKSLGLDNIGFIPCRKFDELFEFYRSRQKNNLQNEFEEKDIEKRINPNFYMEDGKTIISIAFPYYHEENEGNPVNQTNQINRANESNPENQAKQSDNGFSIYTKRADYHRVLKNYLGQICDYIVSLGGKAESFVDSNSLPERYIAYLAGIGFIGRNNMIITEKYGSYVFLGEIITDLEIDCKDQRSFKEISNYIECKDCDRCYKECPTKSINKNRINPNICLSYITQKKEISDKEIKLLKGNVFGCDFCQLKCPYNERVETAVLKEFQTLEYMNDAVATYADMDNKYFKEKISGTSCGWRGKNVIKRNAIIHMHRNGDDIHEFKGDSSYINEYIERLLNMAK